MKPKLKPKPSQLRAYLEQYLLKSESQLSHLSKVKVDPGFLTPEQLFEVCKWKSKRRPVLALQNSKSLVKEITSFAFHAKCEESRIGALTLLKGVSFPTASVILHFCVDRTYPILDFRALWSMGVEQPSFYTADFWVEYVECCRALAKKHGLTVRELDMALWEYSRVNQDA
jgi:hypothetical protein